MDTVAFNEYQDSLRLIRAYQAQCKELGLNYGITYRMYSNSRDTAKSYEKQRLASENTNCPYFVDWSKSQGLRDIPLRHPNTVIDPNPYDFC